MINSLVDQITLKQYDDMHNVCQAESYKEAQHKLESYWLQKTMQQCKYNQSKAAKKMEISRGTLRAKLKEHFGDLYFRDSEI